ncbi:MAG: 2-oxo acid dehydrogenase subunit E2 [Gammaproteobacteria bacterium]|nr:2-oxo acid dehydrogenase subunit E2 [Gammaproteobacteria bacterium]MDH3749541.1 2-oxo acid dehydrogenase subunit E2 [Gammaproteobacteria bacterium]
MSEYVFKLPDLGEGTVESEIAEWFIKVGDQVAEEDIVGTMMTDKAAVELSSPVSGTVIKLAGEPGDIVAVGAALVVYETDATATADAGAVPAATPTAAPGSNGSDGAPAAAAAAAPAEESDTKRTRVITSPAVRRRAKEAGIDLAVVPGTGPGGRVTRKDFEAFVEQAGMPAPVVAEPASRGETKEIKVIGLRRIIAERLATATREIPHFTYVEEIDVTELESLRKHLNDKNPDKSERLTLLPFLGLALIHALRDFPQCNTTYDKDRNILIQHGPVHLGIATQTPDGLRVPVVHHAESLSLDKLGHEIRRISEAARNNRITKNELSGSTITITSLGRLGGIVSTPIINMPEVGIIGVNRAVERPVVMDGQVTVRLMMNLSSSFDHRFVDGYDAAAMIQRIKEMLEHPATIFLP